MKEYLKLVIFMILLQNIILFLTVILYILK